MLLRRVDGLDLHTVDPQPPPPGGIVEHAAEPAVDLVAGGEGLLQVHRADDVAQRGDGELLDGLEVVGNLVGGRTRVGDLEIQHSVDLDDEVVLGDDGLWRERDYLFAQLHYRADPIDERDDEVHAGLQGAMVAAEPLDVACAALRHYAHRPQNGDDDEQDEDQPGDERCVHDHSLG